MHFFKKVLRENLKVCFSSEAKASEAKTQNGTHLGGRDLSEMGEALVKARLVVTWLS